MTDNDHDADIVVRLRHISPRNIISLRMDAADEIERLRSTIHDLSGQENVEGRLIEMKRVGHAEAVALMPDVSDRMRNRYKRFGDDDALIAAEEIDRLRDEVERLRSALEQETELADRSVDALQHHMSWNGDGCKCLYGDCPVYGALDFHTARREARRG